jgi:hypothetical protein
MQLASQWLGGCYAGSHGPLENAPAGVSALGAGISRFKGLPALLIGEDRMQLFHWHAIVPEYRRLFLRQTQCGRVIGTDIAFDEYCGI